MFSKLYEKIKHFIKEYYLYLSLYFVLLAVCLYPLPFYIYTGGGLISVDKRIEIEEKQEIKGSFHLCYVSELRATLPSYILAKILPSWDLSPIEDSKLAENETEEDIFKRDRLFLSTGNTNAISLAYEKAGRSFEITGTKNYILYIDENAKTTLKIGDDIRKINGKEINNLEEISEVISSSNVGDELVFSVIRNGKVTEATGTVYELNGNHLLGIMIQTGFDYKTDPKIELHFSDNEAGSSGGLLLTLSIYNQLTKEDITKGLKIAGTGTIEMDGTVGEIGGVKYKLAGAVKEKADVFLVPKGENYEEAINEKEKHHYKIEIIGVETFDEALKSLENLKPKM